VFATGFILWGSAVVVLQSWRIAASMRRGRRPNIEPSRGFWNLQTWVQFKVLLLLMLVPFLAWLARRIEA
jgi:hypothetical protein